MKENYKEQEVEKKEINIIKIPINKKKLIKWKTRSSK